MAKRRKVLTFHSWLNVALENLVLGGLSLFESVIPLSKSSWRTHGRMS